MIHHPSGAIGECRETRSQLINKQTAFGRMAKTDKFQKWARIHAAEIMGKIDKRAIQERVERLMKPENIKVEVGDGYSWQEEKP